MATKDQLNRRVKADAYPAPDGVVSAGDRRVKAETASFTSDSTGGAGKRRRRLRRWGMMR